MRKLYITLGTAVLLCGTFSSAAAQGKVSIFRGGVRTPVRKLVAGPGSSPVTHVGIREVFPNVVILDDENLTIATRDFLSNAATPSKVRTLDPMRPLVNATAVAEQIAAVPHFVPYDGNGISPLNMKEFLSATPAEAPQWVGAFGLTQGVGVVIISKQGPRVLRTSVAYIDSRTEIGSGKSEGFFQQAVDKNATDVDVYLLANNSNTAPKKYADNYSDPAKVRPVSNSPDEIVRQVKGYLASFSRPSIHYYEKLSGVSQFAVNTQTGLLSNGVSFPRDFRWTDVDELHFNQSIRNALVPAELSPSPAMRGIILQRTHPGNGPVRESFPNLGVEILNDADGTIRPIAGRETAPVIAPGKLPLGSGFTPIDNVGNRLVREHLPGVGYILDDEANTFVPEQ
ncbi:hypothetical protein [Candidatus Avelusimicrobium caledoniensis]|uniref:hypothetical protein n=1 Tax=Candidatus Avelusimicrobium caledoniensis TaxID=3416220 RepID=UPI003D0AD6E8